MSSVLTRFLIASLLIAGVIVVILAQFSVPVLFDADGYLHIRMAEFIRHYGLKYDFHWARYSVFAKNFADKDLLYHILILPFTYMPNIFFGAKLAACLFAIFLYMLYFFILRRYCLGAFVPFFLAALLLSATFLMSMCRARPMVFTIALTLLFVHFLIIKRYIGLFVVTLVYTLSHVSSPFLLFFAFLAEAVRFFNERQFAYKTILAVFLGLLAGFLTHPNFPNNLFVFYLNGILVPVFAFKWGLELGAEFFPTDTRELVLGYPFILAGLLLLLGQSAASGNKIKTSTKIWMAISGFFFVFSFFSKRYLIHFYPLGLVAAGAYCTDWWQSQKRCIALRRNKALAGSVIAGILIVFVAAGISTYKRFRLLALSEMYFNKHYEAAGKWMSQNIPKGELIFHTNWSDSQYFIGINPGNDYFVTLDPIYMYYWDPKKYGLYRDIAFGRAADPYMSLKEVFGVNYGYAGKNYFSGLIAKIRQDKRFSVLAEDELGLIFALR